jgi:hypothetical protein
MFYDRNVALVLPNSKAWESLPFKLP